MSWTIRAWRKGFLRKSLAYKETIFETSLIATITKLLKQGAVKIELEKVPDSMTGADPDVLKIEARLAEAVETEKRAAARVKELTESLNAAKVAQSVGHDADKAAELEKKLEALPWKAAASGKCDFAKDVSADLVQAVRTSKDGVKGASHHFTAANDSPTLFRFRRPGSKA